MGSKLTLSNELRRLVETRIEHTLDGIEDTLWRILENQEMSVEDLKQDLQSLEESFSLLSQKWSLEILYTLFLKSAVGFSELKKILGVNSRTLSDKLKTLTRCAYVERTVRTGPPLRVEYRLKPVGKDIVLLALPLLYYSSSLTSSQSSSRAQTSVERKAPLPPSHD